MNAQIKLVLDTFRQNRIAPVFSMVGDYGAREIRAIITCDGDPHAVPVTAEVTINAKRPDGQEKRFPGSANGDGSVTVPITQWMLERRGGVECTISAVGIGTKLTTTPITLTVLQTPTGEDISPDDPEYDLLAQVLAGEAERVEAEKTRVVNEKTRVDAEAVRAENEAQREASEDVRRTNEAARVNAEQNRADTFAGWVGDMGQLGNFNARLTNVESAIYGDLAREVVDDSVAHTKDVPTNAKPYARIDAVGGMTRKCENLFPYPYSQTTLTKNGITYTDNGNGSITIRGTATDNVTFYLITEETISKRIPIKAGQYTASVSPASDVDLIIGVTNIGEFTGSFSVPEDTSFYARLRVRKDTTINATIHPMLNKGTTALPYEPYFEGLRSAKVESVESVGINIWDEEWESGIINYDTGELVSNPYSIRTKNYIPVEPNTTYYKKSPYVLVVLYYDKNHNIVNRSWSNSNIAFTTPENAYYMKFSFGSYSQSGNVTEYKNDICINKSDEAIDGTYYPYVKHTLPIPEAVRPKHGIPNTDVYDSIEWGEDGKQRSRVKCGVVDLGTLTWKYSKPDGSNCPLFYANVPNLNVSRTNEIFCVSTWEYLYSQYMLSDKTFSKTVYMSGYNLYIRDDSYTDATAFKAAMSGVMLVYELATPTTEDISDILPADNYIGVEGGGTLTFVSEYGYDVPSEVVFVTKEDAE